MSFILSLLVLFYTSLPLMANQLEQYASTPSPYLVNADQRIDDANEKLKNFEEQLAWFLETIQLFEDTKNQKSLPIKEEWLSQYASFKENINDLHDIFLSFRAKLGECQLSIPGSPYNGWLGYTQSFLEVTDWYINYVENTFFPEDWETLYQARKSRSNGNQVLIDQKEISTLNSE